MKGLRDAFTISKKGLMDLKENTFTINNVIDIGHKGLKMIHNLKFNGKFLWHCIGRPNS